MEPAARGSRVCASRMTTRSRERLLRAKGEVQQDWRGRRYRADMVSAGRGHRALGRSPRDGHCHDRGPLHAGPPRVLDARPPDTRLRAGAHAFPSNIRSSQRPPEIAESRVFSFEAIPFVGPRYRPRFAMVRTVADVTLVLHLGCQQADGSAHEPEAPTCDESTTDEGQGQRRPSGFPPAQK